MDMDGKEETEQSLKIVNTTKYLIREDLDTSIYLWERCRLGLYHFL